MEKLLEIVKRDGEACYDITFDLYLEVKPAGDKAYLVELRLLGSGTLLTGTISLEQLQDLFDELKPGTEVSGVMC